MRNYLSELPSLNRLWLFVGAEGHEQCSMEQNFWSLGERSGSWFYSF